MCGSNRNRQQTTGDVRIQKIVSLISDCDIFILDVEIKKSDSVNKPLSHVLNFPILAVAGMERDEIRKKTSNNLFHHSELIS